MSTFEGTADIFGSKATLRLPQIANCHSCQLSGVKSGLSRISLRRRRTAFLFATSGRLSSAEHAEEDFVSAYKMVVKRCRNMRDEQNCDGYSDPQMRRKEPIGKL